MTSDTAAPERTADTAAIRDVIAERERQVAVEGWTHEHDDTHDSGEMLDAAMCYFLHATDRMSYRNVVVGQQRNQRCRNHVSYADKRIACRVIGCNYGVLQCLP